MNDQPAQPFEPDLLELRKLLDLPPLLAKIFLMLLTEKTVTVSMIEAGAGLTEDASVAVHRLRRRLLGSDIEIKAQRGLGYWMDAETKRLVLKRLEAA